MDALELRAPPEIVAALRDGKRSGGWLRAYCPVCDPDRRHRDGGTLAAGILTSGPRKGSPWWGCHRCRCQDDYAAARKTAAMRIQYDRQSVADDEFRRRSMAVEIVDKSAQIRPGDPVDRYLRVTRGLEPAGALWWSDLRRRRLVHMDTKHEYECMVAVVRDGSGQIVACHRTYLFELDDGRVVKINDREVPAKMRHAKSKLVLGSMGGCAVRLGVDSDEIAIAEGIESALGLGRATGLVPWSALNAGNMENVIVPPHVRRIVIGPDLGDKKGVGMTAAVRLRKRLVEEAKQRKKLVSIVIKPPPFGHKDWGERLD